MQTTPFSRRRQPRSYAWATGVALAWVFCAAALFAAPALVAPPPPPPSTPGEVFQERVNTIESELANLLQRRTDAAGPALAIIDYQIDTRLVERWMLSGAMEPPAPISSDDGGPATRPQNEASASRQSAPRDQKDVDESLQACVALRVISLQSAADHVGERLQNFAKSLTPGQLHGLKSLHDLTYGLPDGATVGTVDDVSRKVATALILISNPNPVEIKNLPPMRPRNIVIATTAPTTEPSATRPPTIAELASLGRTLDISPALRKQLQSLAAAAQAPAAGDNASPDAEALYEMLSTSTELAEGLAHNTGVDAAARPKIEQQLTEGLALFTDVRTRAAGQSRVASLSQYRQLLMQLQGMRLPAALLQKLSPTFTWANANPDSGGKVLGAIEKYLQLCTRFDARKPIALPFAQKKAVETLQKQFAAQRANFLDDAAALGAGANPFAAGAPTPGGLVNRVESMRQYLDSLSVIEPSAHAIAALAPYRPRPTGGLEKRAVSAAGELSSTGVVNGRDAAAKFLADVERLARLADSIVTPTGLSSETIKTYAHGRLSAVDAQRATLIGSLASQLASGKEMEISDLLKLDTLRQLYDALRMAGDVEAGLAKAPSLSRWADWSISPDQLTALIVPYRDATAAAFDGFAEENLTPISRWPAIQKRFAPLLSLVKELGQYADQCKDLPVGQLGEFAKLLTPMDRQPFATERYASLAISVWQRAAEGTDTKVADGLFDAMLLQLRKDLKSPAE
ncbi:MAG TPA: hypothetical protein VG326_17640 [Tepidisphaeraceae bacterium]|jgi:hypothetical protein|nr:hypothetical protein [Tepidisphaeraceae bacterium]